MEPTLPLLPENVKASKDSSEKEKNSNKKEEEEQMERSPTFGNRLVTFWAPLTTKLLATVFDVLVIQTAYNYMTLFYSGESYLNVISKEWNLRNTSCYFNSLETDTSDLIRFLTFF